MKSIFYLLTILFLSLLISCSDEPPIGTDIENLDKKPIKNPPTPTEPLVLLDADNQIVGSSWGLGRNSKSKIKVWTHEGNSYSKTWEKEISDSYEAVAIGDVDNDGNDELVAIRYYRTGKGRHKTRHYEVQIFENEATEPTRIGPDFGLDGELAVFGMVLDDANNDGTLEIVVAGGKFIHVFNDDEGVITQLWRSESVFFDHPFGVDVGDANNDGSNDIVYAGSSSHAFGVFEHLGGDNWGNLVYSAPVGILDRAFVADVDGDGLNEIIGGGAYQKLTVWKYVDNAYDIVFESEVLGGYTQGITAGDFDGDTYNEIAVGTAGFFPSKVFVFKYNGSSYANIFEEPIPYGAVHIFAGDSDNDGIDEFVIATPTDILVYDYNSGYSQVYSDLCGEGFVGIN